MVTKRKQYLNWDEYKSCVNILLKQIKKSRIKFDGVYGIPRGGLILAVNLAHELKLPLLLAPTKDTLICDDISDTGETLMHYKKYKIATLLNTNWTSVVPAFFAIYKNKKSDWIIFPWEKQK